MEEIEFKDETIILFANTIRQIVQEEIQNAFKKQNVERFMDLSVVSVAPDASSATLKDLVTKEIFENIPNHTGMSWRMFIKYNIQPLKLYEILI